MDPANYTGVYSAHLFAQKASEVVKNHNTDKVYKSIQFRYPIVACCITGKKIVKDIKEQLLID